MSASSIPPFLGEEDAEASFDKAGVAILPVPYEETVSWVPGTSRGPEAILRASPYLEFYDEQLEVEPCKLGVWTDAMLDVAGIPPERMVEKVADRFGELLDAGKWVVMLGGEHSITPGGVRAALARHEGLHLIQLDAHADLRESYRGDRWNHACAMARCIEMVPLRAVGVRSYTIEEARRIRQNIPGYHLTHAWQMQDESWQSAVLEGLEDRPVYLTFDLDYFDPAIMPATGTPEPGGCDWYPTLEFLGRLFRRARVVACDVVELAPQPGLHHADFTAARLVHKLIGYRTLDPRGGADLT